MANPVYDITFCPGTDCPLRERCWRFRAARPARFDSFGSSPFDAATGACESFWDLAEVAPTAEAIRDRAYHRWVAEGRPEGRDEAHWTAAEAELQAAFTASLEP